MGKIRSFLTVSPRCPRLSWLRSRPIAAGNHPAPLRGWSEYRAYAFHISARDLARFGQLYLNDGRHNDRCTPATRHTGPDAALGPKAAGRPESADWR